MTRFALLVVVIIIIIVCISHHDVVVLPCDAQKIIPQCKPLLGLNFEECRSRRLRVCNNKNPNNAPPKMKYVAAGCRNGTRPAGDGGCQCAP